MVTSTSSVTTRFDKLNVQDKSQKMITKNDIKFIQSLKQTKYRKENKMFIVEGNKLVDELISSNFKIENILVTDFWMEKFPDMTGRLPSPHLGN